ncbi:hypothetical protein Spb1_02310 [Planctopirus ephydatiae]|uniref:Uncharacterized protein n=1 Tax=Planctopirus ephydatiae TaxID=2528019 RepID=A0A518GIG0_9PLAN|nr:hypothetical protein Spb1_02310 [Planctopirus ephydatiae]
MASVECTSSSTFSRVFVGEGRDEGLIFPMPNSQLPTHEVRVLHVTWGGWSSAIVKCCSAALPETTMATRDDCRLRVASECFLLSI